MSLSRLLTAVLGSAALFLATPNPVSAEIQTPAQHALLIDYDTGEVLLA